MSGAQGRMDFGSFSTLEATRPKGTMLSGTFNMLQTVIGRYTRHYNKQPS